MAARPHGTKRSLDGEPDPNYTVYSYFPGQCDKVLLGGTLQNEHLNVKCRACPATFAQKSILEYGVHDEWQPELYIDLQFHQFGQLCLSCRAPHPGEGYFEENHHAYDEKEEKYLVELLTPVLNVEALHTIVLEYYKPEEHPEYPQLKKEHYNMLYNMVATDLYGPGFAKSALLEMYGVVGRTYMSIPGVELVYTRAEKLNPFTAAQRASIVSKSTDMATDNDTLPDIKLDYRYWRPKQCKCTKTPCECICFPAQVRNIKKILKIPNTYKYKFLRTISYTDFDKRNKLSFFVYLRDWTALNPDSEENYVSDTSGVCRTTRKNFITIVTEHTKECSRRNAQYRTYKCMMEEGRCERCEDCLMLDSY
jgi:hypothetical protein